MHNNIIKQAQSISKSSDERGTLNRRNTNFVNHGIQSSSFLTGLTLDLGKKAHAYPTVHKPQGRILKSHFA